MISSSSCLCTLRSVRWREVEKPRESHMCPRFCGWNWKLIVWLITIRSSGSLKGEPRVHGFSLSVCNSSCLDTGSWIIYWSTAPDIIPGIWWWRVNSGSKEAPSLTRQFVNIICWFKWKRRKCDCLLQGFTENWRLRSFAVGQHLWSASWNPLEKCSNSHFTAQKVTSPRANSHAIEFMTRECCSFVVW